MTAEKSLFDEVLSYVDETESSKIWDKALNDINFFARHYVPKEYFNIDKAAPQQLQVLQDVNDGYRNFIIRAPRKGGKTILVAIIVVWMCLKYPRYRFFILSGSLEQAKWLYRYCKGIMTSNPTLQAMLANEPTQILTEIINGSFIICAPASFKQVNAPTVDGLVMDEYVLIPPEIITDAWPMIRASPIPMRIILSTATEKVSLDSFLDLFDRAEELGFRPYFWSDRECVWLDKTDSNVAKAVLSDEDYRIQYEGGVPIKRAAIFQIGQINNAFKKGKNLPDEHWKVAGPIKVGIDWGFTHETAFTAGWLGLNWKMKVFKSLATTKTDDEELADIAVEWDNEFNTKYGQRVSEWICDSEGAFQNALMRKRGLWVTERVFGHRTKGKTWMIDTLNWFLERDNINIPDTDEYLILKKQMKAYRRDVNGFPMKGNDDRIDSLLCLASGWDPTLSLEAPRMRTNLNVIENMQNWRNEDWTERKPRDEAWRPDSWRKVKWPWE